MSGSVPLVRVVRSGLEESVHLGDVAVADASGRLLAFAGDPERILFARSSMKPLQAAVSLSVIGEAHRLSDAEVAVTCGSHNAEPVHLEAVRSILARAGLGFDALRCPPGWPLDPEEMAKAGSKRPELHNCSGKHAGMLLASTTAGWDLETYRAEGHPLQRRDHDAVIGATGLAPVQVGVDGCGVPVHGMPLSRMATLYARLAHPSEEEWGDLDAHARRAVGAMLAEPYLVAGRSRVDTAVMEATRTIAVKAGAEGLLCGALTDRGVGIAVKVADGSPRADDPAFIHALVRLGAIDQGVAEALREHARPPVLGGGEPVGELVADFELEAP